MAGDGKKLGPALTIVKALPHHAEEIGASGIAMMLAICARWDDFRCQKAVCWPNRTVAEKSGISRNSVDRIRKKLVDAGWLLYVQEGRYAGHYTPKLPSWHAQNSASDGASIVHPVVQTLCIDGASDGASIVHPEATYKPIPNPIPSPVGTPPFSFATWLRDQALIHRYIMLRNGADREWLEMWERADEEVRQDIEDLLDDRTRTTPLWPREAREIIGC